MHQNNILEGARIRCGASLGSERPLEEDANCLSDKSRLEQLMLSSGPGCPADLYSTFLEALVAIIDMREHETGQHSKRVACHTQILAKRFISDPDELRRIYWGALLHDIGKIGIPDVVLLKRGPLSDGEWEIMKTHAEKGYQLIAMLPGMVPVAELIWSHEEKFDGTGYPRGLAGDAIPFGARLFAVIDTLDAITSDRPYRKGLGFDAAKDEICRMSGKQFDPVAVEAFIAEEAPLREMVERKCDMHGTDHRLDIM